MTLALTGSFQQPSPLGGPSMYRSRIGGRSLAEGVKMNIYHHGCIWHIDTLDSSNANDYLFTTRLPLSRQPCIVGLLGYGSIEISSFTNSNACTWWNEWVATGQ